ncbi:MAG: TonB-dependent receptor [Acidobacteria bacterium]|nr:TonB-dependent receptor [Acidobacteriota bacterium]
MGRMIVAVAVVLATAGAAWAQEQTGVLQGRAVDGSGAALPGVTVTVTGPTLLGGSRSTTTSELGAYRVPLLPIGLYTVTFELTGFQTKVYENIRVQTGVTFSLDAQLGVAALQETVTVSGASPIIDSAATNVSFTYTKELMNTIPNARDVWAMVSQAPGMTTSALNVGGTNTGNQVQFRAHGTDPRQNTFILAGANVTDNSGTGGSQFYYDIDSFDEMQIEMNSHGADVQTPGIILNMVPRSGTNLFRGSGSLYYGDDRIQSDNVDDDLRGRGVDRASNLKSYFDGGVDIGGPILTDRLWFWGAYRYQEIERLVTGTRNADGSFPIDRTLLWYPTGKVSWQATAAHNASLFFNMQQKKRFNSGLSALRPLETTVDQQNDPISRVFSLRDDWVVTPRLLVSVKGYYLKGAFRTTPVDGAGPDTPPQFETSTNAYSGAPPSLLRSFRQGQSAGVTANYTADGFGGRHDLKAGLDLSRFEAPVETTYPGDHQLNFFQSAPLEVLLYAPGRQNSVAKQFAAFVQDGWVRNRFTFNLGVRLDHQSSYLPEETAPASRFFADRIVQAKTDDLITWTNASPRLGVIYDVTGSAKTLVKANYARYYWQIFTTKTAQASLAGTRSFRYTWNDVNGDRQFTTNELGELRALDDPATRPISIDPGLEPTYTDEITASIVHELMPNVSLSATVIARNDNDFDWRISAAKRALSPNFIATRPNFSQEYRGVELTLQRRLTGRWQLVGSTTFGVQREDLGASPETLLAVNVITPPVLPAGLPTPQDVDKINGTRIDTSIPVVGKLMGSYQFPFRLSVSGFYQFLAGAPFTRTVNAVSALGRNLNQGNVVIHAGERNVDSYDNVHVVDVRLNYDLPMVRPNTSLALDIFNATNTNTVTRVNSLSGAAFNRVTEFVPPRVVRFGIKVRF